MKTHEFTSAAEVRALVAAFEDCSIAPSAFTHAAHMAVALAYLDREPVAQAEARMKESLLRFTSLHQINLYHETLTLFWMHLLNHLAENSYAGLPLWQRVTLIVEKWGSRAPVEAHFSPELIRSREAKESWQAPDRLPLPFPVG